MSYCSIDEAWNGKEDNISESDYLPREMWNLDSFKQTDSDKTNPVVPKEEKTDVYDHIQTTDKQEEITKCHLAISHINECPECRGFLQKLMEKKEESVNTLSNIVDTIKEKSKTVVDNPIYDIVLYVLIGIFIILVLDAFVSIGKAMAKRE